MHRLPSCTAVYRFRLCAVLFCFRYLLLLASFCLVGYAMALDHREFLMMGVGLSGLTIIVFILQWMLGLRTRCPLCVTPVLANKGCSKHRKASPLLGSYRLRVALSIFFRGYFVCQYCNEPTSMEVRVRRRRYSQH